MQCRYCLCDTCEAAAHRRRVAANEAWRATKAERQDAMGAFPGCVEWLCDNGIKSEMGYKKHALKKHPDKLARQRLPPEEYEQHLKDFQKATQCRKALLATFREPSSRGPATKLPDGFCEDFGEMEKRELQDWAWNNL